MSLMTNTDLSMSLKGFILFETYMKLIMYNEQEKLKWHNIVLKAKELEEYGKKRRKEREMKAARKNS